MLLPKEVVARLVPSVSHSSMYRSVEDWHAQLSLRNHAFWYVQGSDGQQSIISAGPSRPNGSGFLNGGANPDVRNGDDNVSARTWWDSGLSAANCASVDKMLNAARTWHNDKVPYHPAAGPNSDSFAHYIGLAGGYDFFFRRLG